MPVPAGHDQLLDGWRCLMRATLWSAALVGERVEAALLETLEPLMAGLPAHAEALAEFSGGVKALLMSEDEASAFGPWDRWQSRAWLSGKSWRKAAE